MAELPFKTGCVNRLVKQDISTSRERTGLVARTVFKIAEVVARRLVGSIPTRSRQNHLSTRHNSAQAELVTAGFAP